MAGMGGGDVIAQAASDEAYDPARTSRFAAFGFLAHGTLCHQFYKILDKVRWRVVQMVDHGLWLRFQPVVIF